MSATGPIVVKIGGSTLGAEDTTVDDIALLQRNGQQIIVVHGGGAMITDWLDRLQVPSEFVDGLRATTAAALEVVIAVLRGIINTQLVAEIGEHGGRAIGLSGIDGGIVRAERYDNRLGFVGRITAVDGAFLRAVCNMGVIPVIAPIGLEPPSQALNINADTVAGEVARAVEASRLIFLTDVDGLLDGDGRVVEQLRPAQAAALRASGTMSGGMIPKVDACMRAAEAGALAYMANGRQPRTLRSLVEGATLGTLVEA